MWLVKMVFIVGFCFTILYPLAVMLSRAFMSRADIFDNAVILVPRELTLDNIRYAAQMMNYGPTLWNTLWYALSTTVMQTLSTMMVGYGFARFRFRGSRVLFGLVVFTIILPPQLIMVPLYMHFRFFIFLESPGCSPALPGSICWIPLRRFTCFRWAVWGSKTAFSSICSANFSKMSPKKPKRQRWWTAPAHFGFFSGS